MSVQLNAEVREAVMIRHHCIIDAAAALIAGLAWCNFCGIVIGQEKGKLDPVGLARVIDRLVDKRLQAAKVQPASPVSATPSFILCDLVGRHDSADKPSERHVDRRRSLGRQSEPDDSCANPPAGQYDIWVGTVAPKTARAVLHVTELRQRQRAAPTIGCRRKGAEFTIAPLFVSWLNRPSSAIIFPDAILSLRDY